MGAQRRAVDHDAGRREAPKLTWGGRINASVDGRPYDVIADGDRLVVRGSSVAALWRLRKRAKPVRPLILGVQRLGAEFRVEAGRTWIDVRDGRWVMRRLFGLPIAGVGGRL